MDLILLLKFQYVRDNVMVMYKQGNECKSVKFNGQIQTDL